MGNPKSIGLTLVASSAAVLSTMLSALPGASYPAGAWRTREIGNISREACIRKAEDAMNYERLSDVQRVGDFGDMGTYGHTDTSIFYILCLFSAEGMTAAIFCSNETSSNEHLNICDGLTDFMMR